MVEEDLYRSGQPSEINFPFLSTLNLKTVIWLAVEEPQENFLAWADENDITIHHLGIQEGRDIWDPMLTEDCVVDALNVIVRVGEIGPLAIMCNLGRHRTGTVVGCLRRLQRWNLARYLFPLSLSYALSVLFEWAELISFVSVTDEYRRYAGHRWRGIDFPADAYANRYSH
jgi:hypothetical protein